MKLYQKRSRLNLSLFNTTPRYLFFVRLTKSEFKKLCPKACLATEAFERNVTVTEEAETLKHELEINSSLTPSF